MNRIFFIFCLTIFPLTLTAEEISVHKDKDGIIYLYNQASGQGLESKNPQETNEISPRKRESLPRKVFKETPLINYKDEDLCRQAEYTKGMIKGIHEPFIKSLEIKIGALKRNQLPYDRDEEELDQHKKELLKLQKKYPEIQDEIQRRNIDCSRD